MKPLLLIAPLLIALSISSANAQSLFLTEQAEQPIEEQSTPILSVEQVSLVYTLTMTKIGEPIRVVKLR